jgi:gamma-glutamyltranspeptidase/glutathione hydrolase
MLIADSFASTRRPALFGNKGTVSAAHPLAVSAGLGILSAGGSAVDAVIAGQAVLCVLDPEDCSVGGDALTLVRMPDGAVTAVNGTGAAPHMMAGVNNDGGSSVTVPGVVDAWETMNRRWGRLPLATVLAPALDIARDGFRVGLRLPVVSSQHAARLLRGGASGWAVLDTASGGILRQPALAALLQDIGVRGGVAFYEGQIAEAIAAAVRKAGGMLEIEDLARHRTVVTKPVTTRWRGCMVHVQPPVSQGVLLSMALAGEERLAPLRPDQRDHALVELTESAFAYRDQCGKGSALLGHPLHVDLDKASRRGGPRAYLHTAGVAASDASGMTVSSLVSIFDSFGSGVFVPEGGFTLNNRAAGFTSAPNEAAGGKRPIHTLAPVIVETVDTCVAMATPGADGQIQTLLQVLVGLFVEGVDLATAIARPRWRSENSRLLVENTHAYLERLSAFGHEVVPTADGDLRFGAIVCAGMQHGRPFCCADWRRETWASVI